MCLHARLPEQGCSLQVPKLRGQLGSLRDLLGLHAISPTQCKKTGPFLCARAQARSVFALQAGFDEVTDVQWSPESATALVVVKGRGVLEVSPHPCGCLLNNRTVTCSYRRHGRQRVWSCLLSAKLLVHACMRMGSGPQQVFATPNQDDYIYNIILTIYR